jgi:hypothetical protein
MARQVIDWRAIPRRYRAWKELPAWRKVLWAVTRTVMSVVLYVASVAAVLWFNEPGVVGGIAEGSESPLALVGLFAAQPELLALVLLLFPAVLAAVVLPHRTAWN